ALCAAGARLAGQLEPKRVVHAPIGRRLAEWLRNSLFANATNPDRTSMDIPERQTDSEERAQPEESTSPWSVNFAALIVSALLGLCCYLLLRR
ncbi:MAG: hypothetical protein O7A69_07630, partial [SAR324 cluster bacterium]|nr:hypothetical protein [SAR324 cluster bacterium]